MIEPTLPHTAFVLYHACVDCPGFEAYIICYRRCFHVATCQIGGYILCCHLREFCRQLAQSLAYSVRIHPLTFLHARYEIFESAFDNNIIQPLLSSPIFLELYFYTFSSLHIILSQMEQMDNILLYIFVCILVDSITLLALIALQAVIL